MLLVDTTTGILLGTLPVRFSPGGLVHEEIEGLTLWDLDDGRAPHVGGQLHLLLLDNDLGPDELIFKHWRATSPSKM